MGYASYTVTRRGEVIEAGYGIDAVCEQEGCTEEIDRGLAYLCGETPGDNEHGCGGYFCGAHLFMGPDCQLCGDCAEKIPDDEDEEA